MTEPHPQDFEDPEDFADAVGPDPTPQQVDEYREETERPHRRDTDGEPGDSA
ncbi:hypothetical protein [Actinosynnema sp. ALI-1.44]|uniref:hypothetical protein n=1 Tax=Actinosynnema sp. ALI-1.44 TaxID=1933779 RepID=UPI00143DAA22|nr:hypothetical protein [Actinosynnema sp. ALI-1.44]